MRPGLPHLRVVCAVAAIAAAACGRARDTDPRLVSEWVHALYGLVRVERLSPAVASRVFAYASSALYFGLSATSATPVTTANLMNGLPEIPRVEAGREVDPGITAVTAERVTLDSLLREALPTTRSAIARLADSLAATRVAAGVSAATKANSEALGTRIGLAIVTWAHGDGFDSTRGLKYVPPKGPGLWVNDSPPTVFTTQNVSGASELVVLDNPANARRPGNTSDRGLILSRPKLAGSGTMPAVNMAGATEPWWGYNRLFALKRWDDCPAPALPPFSTKPGSPIYEEAKEVFNIRANLTEQQRLTALYWADNAGESGTPAGHWLSIASQMVGEKKLSAVDAARLMLVTSVSLADAFIATWAYKFRLNLIRPRTYIRAVMDSTWEPAIPTPPFPEYVSGHSAVSAAAAAAITAVLGNVPFEDSTSVSLGHGVRKFESFKAASENAGLSRVYGGIHFPSGNVQGRALGNCVGEKVVERLRPIGLK